MFVLPGLNAEGNHLSSTAAGGVVIILLLFFGCDEKKGELLL